MGNVLKIENLKYKEILKDITFSLKEKSLNILVGPNGSGKTTIVNCIRGLLNYNGNIKLFDNIIDKKTNSNLYREVGFFLDEEILFKNTVLEELLLFLKNLNYDEEKAKKTIYNIAKKMDISYILLKEQKNLFLHEKVLVSFIFSIIHEPKLLIIDNDLEILDEKNKTKIFDYLKSQKNLTILFITTNSEYFYMADNLIFLKDGKVVLNGNFEQIIENEKILIKSGSNLPFTVDLSKKLISYKLLDHTELNIEKMVNEIWK